MSLPKPKNRLEHYLAKMAGMNVDTPAGRTRKEQYLDYIAEHGIVGSNSTLPKLFLTGDTTGISKKNAVDMKVEYVNSGKNFTDKCTLKYQGTSSLNYPKKNFTIKLGSKVDLGFGQQKKYCLKANYIDHSHARNIVSARLWSEIVKSRESYNKLPVQLKNSPNNGAIDGYPIKLYLNGKYEGLYTLNVPKDAWMFGMDDSKDEHCVLCGEDYGSGCFRAPAKIDGKDWSDEIHDTVPTTILTRWNEVIDFVMNSTDEEFKADIDNYIDLQSLIDYYIFAYVSCGIDSMGKNQIYCTYDGVKWYASMYDMDSTWGLYWNGSSFVSAEYKCQEEYESMVDGRPGNLLYLRLANVFSKEIIERYNTLRKSVLSIKNIICKFEEFTDLISSDLYTEDGEIYTGIPSKTTNNIKQIRAYAKDRLAYVDNNIVDINLTDIALSSSLAFSVNSETKLTTTLTPANANNYNLTYESSNTGVATVDNTGLVTGVSEGTATITVTDSISGVSATLDITVGAEISLDANLVFRLDSTSVNDGTIADLEKDGITYPVTTNGTLTVDDSDNGIVFDGTQTFTIDLSNDTNIIGDVSRTIVEKFMVSDAITTPNSYEILGHANILTDGKFKWGTGHTGAYVKNLNNEIILLLDTGAVNVIAQAAKVSLPVSTEHTLVMVYDKDNAIYKIYLDGSFVKSTTYIDNKGIQSCKYIGNTEGDHSFLGKIYELSLYDKALTAEEIASLQ